MEKSLSLSGLERAVTELAAGDYEVYKLFAADALSFIDPRQPYGTMLYDALANLTWSIAFEAVLLRERDGKVEVYLRQRAADDTAYPSEWHAPGSVFRPREREHNVVDRLAMEFGDVIKSYRHVGDHLYDEARGDFISRIYLVEVDVARLDERHGWYPVDDLPKVTVDHHELYVIPIAVAAFKKERGIE